MKKVSLSRMIIGYSLALLFGICSSGVLFKGIQISMLVNFVTLSPILASFLYAFAGIWATVVMLLTMLVGGLFSYGGLWSGCLALAVCVPVTVTVYSSKTGAYFFSQLRRVLVAQALGLVAALGIVFLKYGENISVLAARGLESLIDGMPPEHRETLVDVIKMMAQQLGSALEGDTAEILGQLVASFESFVEVGLPIMLVSFTAVNACASVLWCNFLRSRHGEDNVKYVSLSGWRLQPALILGLTACFVVTRLMCLTEMPAWIQVFSVVSAAVSFAALIQALASILNRMKKNGMRPFSRNALAVASVMFLGEFLTYYGMLSAFIGSQGVITLFLKSRAEKNRQDKEDF